MASLWDHDLWQEIYEIEDAKTKQAIADLYRLLLDIRETDVLAAKIALKVDAEKHLILTRGQKVLSGLFAVLILSAQIYSFFPHK
jgi:hypothetical protein